MLAFDRYREEGRPCWVLPPRPHSAWRAPAPIRITSCSVWSSFPWPRALSRSGVQSLRRTATGVVAVSIVTGLLLAYQFLPLAELYAHSIARKALPPGRCLSTRSRSSSSCTAFFRSIFRSGNRFLCGQLSGAATPFYFDIYWGTPLLVLAITALGWVRNGSGTQDSPLSARPNFRPAVLTLLSLAFVGAVLSLGTATPGFAWLLTVAPALNRFRFPAKYLFFTAFGVPILAALGVEGLQRGEPAVTRTFRQALVAGFGG